VEKFILLHNNLSCSNLLRFNIIKNLKEDFEMAISLQKGQKVDLTKTNPGLTKVYVGLGWDTNKYDGGNEFDLDASVFLLNENGKVNSDADFIFYNNKKHSSNSVEHLGDNLTGAGEGDDEQVKVDLSAVPENIHKIAFTVTINEAEARRQNFGQVSNAFIRVYSADNGEELIRYDLGEDFSIETAVVVGELYRNGNEWKFNATGSGFQGGLAALCNNFGISV
jgi:tellurium resistance protein TerD